MALPESIRNQIVNFAISKDPDDMVNYLKELLQKNEVLAQDLFNYSKDFVFTEKANKPHVVSPKIINKLGVVISQLDDDTQNKLAIDFYLLAAKRGSIWGHRNCALKFLYGDEKLGLLQSNEKALEYAQKAVELANKCNDSPDEHKLVLCRAQRANYKYTDANKSLIDFIKFQQGKLSSQKDKAKKDTQKKLDEAFELCRTIMDEFHADFEEQYKDELDDELCKNCLQQLDPFFQTNIENKSYQSIIQEAYFLAAGYHVFLKEYPDAMKAYCVVTDKSLTFFNQSVKARANLLKLKVNGALQSNAEPKPVTTDDSTITLPDQITLPTNFATSWKEDTSWFHSVDENALQKEYDKRMLQIDHLIKGVETKIDLLKEAPNSINENETIQKKKENLNEELSDLKREKNKLRLKYHAHLSKNRSTFRRHKAETYFFNPNRSRKRERMNELTSKIIDHRFNIDGEPLDPIVLTGNSSRLLISAEKAFQQAVMDLTGTENPRLGIPKARIKNWTVGSYYNRRSGTTGYGPVEHYQVDDTYMQSEHRSSPKRQRLGDTVIAKHGSYDNDIFPFLIRLTVGEKSKEMQLATFMIRYGKSHVGIKLDELKKIYNLATQNDVDHFNHICFLTLAKEQAQWHSANETSYHLGMAVAQARCLIMIESGFISFEEAFKNDVFFGVYSQTGIVDNPSNVSKACDNIEILYQAYLNTKHTHDHALFTKTSILSGELHKVVLTREQAHQDMKYVYGGDSDTDGEGYDTDISFSP